jgi:hypothetical protein
MLHNNLPQFDRGESLLAPAFREKLNNNFERCLTGARSASDNVQVDIKNGILLIGVENTGNDTNNGVGEDVRVAAKAGEHADALDVVLAGDTLLLGTANGWIGTSVESRPDTPLIKFLEIKHLGPVASNTTEVHPIVYFGTENSGGTALEIVYNKLWFDERGHLYVGETALKSVPLVICGTT